MAFLSLRPFAGCHFGLELCFLEPAWLYARFQQVPFIEGLANGLMNVTSPDSTVALLLALGLMLLVIGVIFVPLFYLTVAVQGLIRVLTLKPIRI